MLFNYSTKFLAPIPERNLSTSYLSQIETGTREGGIDTLKRLAAILRVSIDDLV